MNEAQLTFDSLESSFDNGNVVAKDKNSDFAIEISEEINLNEGDFNF
jgi:hypothetical protein